MSAADGRGMAGTTHAFEEVYGSPQTAAVPYQDGWANTPLASSPKTGYYDGATTAPVNPGAVVSAYDQTSNRKLLLVGTDFGAVVVFQRYAGGASDVYVANFPKEFPGALMRMLGAGGSLNAVTIEKIVGGRLGGDNLGTEVRSLLLALKAAECLP